MGPIAPRGGGQYFKSKYLPNVYLRSDSVEARALVERLEEEDYQRRESEFQQETGDVLRAEIRELIEYAESIPREKLNSNPELNAMKEAYDLIMQERGWIVERDENGVIIYAGPSDGFKTEQDEKSEVNEVEDEYVSPKPL